jgi:NAD(P)-dependent dehydrogenase (short-subunit alcohol dehydrogenase family)
MSQSTSPVCIVTGVGAGTGAAVCRRFAREGYRVAMLARSAESLAEFEAEIAGTVGFPTDVTDEPALRATLQRVRNELGPARVLVHNAGNASFGDLMNVDTEKFQQAWKINTLALFVCGQEVAPDMIAAGRGTIIVTGATASLRGGAAFAAFASAKAGQRALAQSMARLLGPKGVHVAYVVIDGVIDMPRTREFMANAPKESFLAPDEIAETYWQLSRQDRSAWTFELDLRPFTEKW